MEINLNRGIEIVPSIWKGPAKRADRLSKESEVVFEESHILESKLAAEPEVRPEAVERAQELFNDVSYPPAEAIDKIAALLAANMDVFDE